MQHPVFYLFCFPPSAAAERSEPSELHDRWTFSVLQNALCPASDPEWQDAHPEFTRIVFHGLRHSSATYQLMISGGDVKAVQGTTSMTALLELLKNADPKVKAQLRLALLT